MSWILWIIICVAFTADLALILSITLAIMRARSASSFWKQTEITWVSDSLGRLIAEVKPHDPWLEDANKTLANSEMPLYRYEFEGVEYSSSKLSVNLIFAYDYRDFENASIALDGRRVLVNPKNPCECVLVARISGGVRASILIAILLSAGISAFVTLQTLQF